MKPRLQSLLPLWLLLVAGISARRASGGLVSHWNLDQNAGITAIDSGPANNPGTLTNFSTGTFGWTTGKVGAAVALTGNGSSVPAYGGFVTMGHRASLNFNSTNAFSISAWMKVPSGSPQDVTVAGKMIQGTTAEGHYSGYELHYYGGGAFGGGVTAGTVIVWIINDYTVKHIGVRSSNLLINDGNWHHVAFTYTGSGAASGVAVYVDGIKDGSAIVESDTLGTSSIQNTVSFNIGSRSDGLYHNFTGSIDDVQVYNHSLTAGDMLSIYQNPGSVILPPVPVPGDVDAGFNPNVNGSSQIRVLNTTVQPDGKILLGGAFTSVGGQTRNHLARLNADGTVEGTNTFNPGTGADTWFVVGVVVQPDGKILLGGFFTAVNGQTRHGIARLNADGTLEGTNTFNPGTGANTDVYDVAVQTDGKILLAGEFTSVNGQTRNHIARLNADGTLESTNTFNPGTGVNGHTDFVLLQQDGKILLGGQLTSVNGQALGGIARLNPDGTVESTNTFNPGSGSSPWFRAAAVQPDGKIVVVGSFTAVNGQPRNGIARLNADGTLESTSTFNAGTGANGLVQAVTLQTDGKILVGGFFTTVNNQSRNYLARLNPDGTLEGTNTFNPGTGPGSFLDSVAVQADGKILIGGSFTSVNGQPRNYVARLLNDAAIQSLVISNGTHVQWLRSGASPEVWQVTFEVSTNGGASWSQLGPGSRVAGGWERAGLSLSGSGTIRARGRTSGGNVNGASGLVETLATFALPTVAAVTFSNLSQTYSGTARTVTVTTAPTNLTVNVTYNGSANPPTNVGSYTVIGTISDANYVGSATNTLVVSPATATVTLGSLSQTYNGMARSVTITTAPTNLTVNVTYNGSASPPTNVGSYTVIGTVNDVNYVGSATNTLVVSPATATVTLGSLSQTYNGTARTVTVTTAPTNLTVNVTYNGSTSPPTNVGSYTVIGTVSDTNYVGSATNTLVVSPATATVTLGSLSQTYNGTARSVTITTAPTNLTVNVTYNGTANPPTNVGSYTVIGTVSDTNYVGSATNTLVVSPATATVTLGSLSQIYNGTARSVTVTTAPTNLTVNVTYNGSASPPMNVGSYTVIGTINDANYVGSATNTLVVSPATAAVTLGSLSQTYNGTARSVTVTTAPTNLTVNVTYNGSASPPTNVGSYTVIGTVNDTNYVGSATNTLVVSPATAAVTLGSLSQTYNGTARSVTVTTAPTNLTVNVTYNGSTSPPTNVGSYTVIGTINDANYVGSATNTLVIIQTFFDAGPLSIARYWHTATLLPNGKVLVAGGANGSGALGSTELYDPATGLWTATGALNIPRYWHRATLLPNGKVLVAGGVGSSGYLTSAEVYDPTTGIWTATGALSTSRFLYTATLLGNGKVLVTGGYNGSYIFSAELYDPTTGTWTATGAMSQARYVHTATLLANGKVLVTGGFNGNSQSSAEVYNPLTGTWTATGALGNARYWHAATLLPNGKVLVAGGLNGVNLSSAEVYDPASGTWAATGALSNARYVYTATLLSNGTVIAVGGQGTGGNSLASAEVYDSTNGTWAAGGVLNTARYRHTATLLGNGKVLVAGGFGSSGALASAELYDLITGTLPAGYNQLSGQLLGAGNVRLSYVGIPGTNYALERTFTLSPVNWVPLVTNPAGPAGLLVFTNTPSTNTFWRVRSVP